MKNLLNFGNMVSIWHFMLAIWTLAFTLLIYGTNRALRALRKQPSDCLSQDGFLPPVSILKPLKGFDDGLETNLESFFQLDYPEFELLFSVADYDDAAIPLVQKLFLKYPKVQARLYVGALNVGLNPKINNFYQGYKDARHGTILISDSNTRVEPDYLRKVCSQFTPDVAMQGSIIFGANPEGLGGALEATFMNTYYARSMLMVESLGHPCIIGKAMMFRKQVIESIGGFPSFSEYIAEDYEAGRRVHLAGYKVQSNRYPIPQHIGKYSLEQFWSRHVRWGRLRKMQAPFPFFMEFLIGCVASAVIGAVAFEHLFHFPPVAFIALHMACWFVCDSLVMNRVGQKFSWTTAPVWLLRELLHLPLWLHISLGNSIQWRGREIELGRGGIAQLDPQEEEVMEAWSRA